MMVERLDHSPTVVHRLRLEKLLESGSRNEFIKNRRKLVRKYLVLLFGIHLLLPLTAFAQEDSTTKDRDSDVQVEEKQEATTHADKLAESKKQFADMNRKLMEKSRAMQAEMADADQEEMMEAVMQLQ